MDFYFYSQNDEIIMKLITLSYSCNHTDLCIFIRTNDVTSGIVIGIGINRSQYWVLGAELGIVLTLVIEANLCITCVHHW